MKIITLVDNTGSMGEAADSARESAQEMQIMLNLLFGKPVLRAAVYGDFDLETPDHECGGFSIHSENAPTVERMAWFEKYMCPCGGGGCPEAQKTAFNHLLQMEEERCIIFHITDAPPHMSPLDEEGEKESDYLQKRGMEQNWDRLSESVRKSHRVVTLLTSPGECEDLVDIYSKLGEVITLPENSSSTITATTMEVLGALIGLPQDTFLQYHVRDQENGSTRTISKIETELEIDLSDAFKSAKPKLVLEAFEQLLDPSQPHQALCLTTNPILGQYWRLICGRYRYVEDGRYATWAETIMNMLSESVAKMAPYDQFVMKKWIEKSHVETEVIRNMVSSAMASCSTVLVLPDDPKVNVDQLLALGRGGGHYSELSRLIASMKEVPVAEVCVPENEDEPPNFIPLQGLKEPIQVFRLIANVIVPGILFSSQTAMLAATLALNNAHISAQAEELLAKRKGTWIDFSLDDDGAPKIPTNFALNFLRILRLVPDQHLSTEEVEFRNHYLLVEKLLRNLEATITIETGLMRETPKLDVTWKRLCKKENGGCEEERCFTIFPGDETRCGLCLSSAPPKLEDAANKTYWAQCHNCRVNYGISAVKRLGVRPKCHYCRKGMECPTVICHLCQHKYANQGQAAETAMDRALASPAGLTDDQLGRIEKAKAVGRFVCPRCVHNPTSMLQETEVKLVALVQQNPELQKLVPVSDYGLLTDSSLKLWKRVLAIKTTETDIVHPSINVQWKGYIVHNPTAVASNFANALVHAAATTPCPMCVEDRPLHAMTEACGKCNRHMCQNCVRGWYGQVAAGGIISEALTKCPFCKSPPKYKIIKNLAQAHVHNIRPSRNKDAADLCQWESNMWHAICRQCWRVSPCMEKNCAAEAPRVTAFLCDTCSDKNRTFAAKDAIVKKCPNCAVTVQRVGGCNHMTCSNCNDHWCWSCGVGGFDTASIYDHMSQCGGIFPDGTVDEDEGYYED